jgi:hypothetical protein
MAGDASQDQHGGTASLMPFGREFAAISCSGADAERN